MRKLLLAGSALMLMGGVALAQSSSGTASGSMSNGGTQSTTGSLMGNTGPSGKHTMPKQRRSTMDKTMKKGNGTGTSGAGMGNGSTHSSSGMATKTAYTPGDNPAYISHSMGGAMPESASPSTYLQIAQHAIMSRNKDRAQVALGRAETGLLTNSYVEGTVGNGAIHTPAIGAIRQARSAVKSGDFSTASSMIHRAMTEMHGGGMGMGHGMMNHSAMGNGAMNHGAMGQGGMSGTGAGMSNRGMSNQGNMSQGGMQSGSQGGMGAAPGGGATSGQGGMANPGMNGSATTQ
ncbi:MAG: hypothetical protein ACYCZB_04960 [Acidiphilium sp.]